MNNHDTITVQLGLGPSPSVKDPPDISGAARLTRPPITGIILGLPSPRHELGTTP